MKQIIFLPPLDEDTKQIWERYMQMSVIEDLCYMVRIKIPVCRRNKK